MLLEIAARGRGPKAELARAELEGPEFPEEMRFLHNWLAELQGSRRYGMGGPEPISYLEVDAWARLTGRRPAPHEVTALMTLDRVHLFPGPPEPILDD